MAKSKKSKKSLGLFMVSLIFTLLFAGLTIGLSARPYSTITPYTYKTTILGNEVKTSVAYFSDKVVTEISSKNDKSKTETELTANAKEALVKSNKEGNINAFEAKITSDTKALNIGNIVIVAICGALAVVGIGMTAIYGKKAF